MISVCITSLNRYNTLIVSLSLPCVHIGGMFECVDMRMNIHEAGVTCTCSLVERMFVVSGEIDSRRIIGGS